MINQTTNHQEVLDKHPALLEPVKCLNHGFVRLIDWMGSDKRILDSARVSYGQQEKEKTPEEDKKLLFYLMKNFHTSPTEQVIFTFHIKMPIFVMRQHIRHRTARLNEISGRYSILKDEFYVPDFEDIRPQSKINKQGRDEKEDLDSYMKKQFQDGIYADQQRLYEHYKDYIDLGMAKEIARINLPLSIYTEMYWQIDAHNLMHYLKLRLHEHAQKEIRVYAEAMYKIFKLILPITSEAFEEFQLNAKTLSKSEWEQVQDKLNKI